MNALIIEPNGFVIGKEETGFHFVSRSHPFSKSSVDEWGKGDERFFVGLETLTNATSGRISNLDSAEVTQPLEGVDFQNLSFFSNTREALVSLDRLSCFLKLCRVVSHLLVLFSFSMFIEGFLIQERLALILLAVSLYLAAQRTRKRLQKLRRKILKGDGVFSS